MSVLGEVSGIARIEDAPLESLLDALRAYRQRQARFITASCLDRGDRFEILYLFDEDLRTVAVRTLLPKGAKLPSATGVYLCAFLVENELQDLFGIEVEGLHIDYSGKFLVTDTFDAPPLLKQTACELQLPKENPS
ncbi:MAG: NADH-quinone oxidoreductase subunit C [Fimbriimonadales bacterium]|nr:NADH-quinone oxidoreductase subunit C [Fimbriimonadales bacterium]